MESNSTQNIKLVRFDGGGGRGGGGGPHVHRAKISKLREQWLDREMLCQATPPIHMKVESTASTSDSGLGLSPLEDVDIHGSVTPSREQRNTKSTPLSLYTSAATDGMAEQVLIATIQSEAELSQHTVEMLSSTMTMRRRKELYDCDLTYRRRGRRAKQSLCTYTPQAPKQSNWGDIFDDMMSELRGKRKSEQKTGQKSQRSSVVRGKRSEVTAGSQCECACCNGSSRRSRAQLQHCLSDSTTASYQLESFSGDAADYTWVTSTISDYASSACHRQSTDTLTSPVKSLLGDPTSGLQLEYVCCELARTSFTGEAEDGQEKMTSLGYGEEIPSLGHRDEITSLSHRDEITSLSHREEMTSLGNKGEVISLGHREKVTSLRDGKCELDTQTDGTCFWEENWNDNSSSDSHMEYCEGCEDSHDACHSNIKPSFCYKNQNCPSFDRSSSAIGSIEPHSPVSTSQRGGGLHSVSFHRPDLASVTLPLSPIRKTESNSHVWIERAENRPGPSNLNTKQHSRHTKPFTSIWRRIKGLFNTR